MDIFVRFMFLFTTKVAINLVQNPVLWHYLNYALSDKSRCYYCDAKCGVIHLGCFHLELFRHELRKKEKMLVQV